MTWRDFGLNTFDRLIRYVSAEQDRQVKKWGIQERSPFEWLAYLTEEVGEVANAISEWYYRNGYREAIQKEAIQVATLALKIAEMAEWSGLIQKEIEQGKLPMDDLPPR